MTTQHTNKIIVAATIVVSLMISGLIVFTVGLYEGWWMRDAAGNPAESIFTLLLIGALLLILLIANLVLTGFNIKHKEALSVHAYAWAPTLLVLMGVAMLQGLKGAKQHTFEQNHPNIYELHINLSDHHAWVMDSDSALPKAPEQFVEITRYAQDGLEKMQAYQGARLNPSFKQATFYVDDIGEHDADNRVLRTVPIVQPSSYPDVASFIPLIKADSISGYTPTEAALWVYQYYYYSDRVEVVPAINLSGSDSIALRGSELPITGVRVESTLQKAVARIEVDGATLALGSQPLTLPDKYCVSPQHYVLNRFDAPVKVRWQYLEADPQWHEAMVTVSKRPTTQAAGWKMREEAVFLYLQQDGTIASQRQLVMVGTDKQGEEKVGIRTTPIQPALLAPSPCGSALDRWQDTVERLPN